MVDRSESLICIVIESDVCALCVYFIVFVAFELWMEECRSSKK